MSAAATYRHVLREIRHRIDGPGRRMEYRDQLRRFFLAPVPEGDGRARLLAGGALAAMLRATSTQTGLWQRLGIGQPRALRMEREAARVGLQLPQVKPPPPR